MKEFPNTLVQCAECEESIPYKTHKSEPEMLGITVKKPTPCCGVDGVVVAVSDEQQ